jgi:hypothetical protein
MSTIHISFPYSKVYDPIDDFPHVFAFLLGYLIKYEQDKATGNVDIYFANVPSDVKADADFAAFQNKIFGYTTM